MKRSGALLDDAEAAEGGLTSPNKNTTTNFLTATALTHAIGAGITAVAGTSLALQWILVKVFKLLTSVTRHGCPGLLYIVTTYLSGLGSLRAGAFRLLSGTQVLHHI